MTAATASRWLSLQLVRDGAMAVSDPLRLPPLPLVEFVWDEVEGLWRSRLPLFAVLAEREDRHSGAFHANASLADAPVYHLALRIAGGARGDSEEVLQRRLDAQRKALKPSEWACADCRRLLSQKGRPCARHLRRMPPSVLYRTAQPHVRQRGTYFAFGLAVDWPRPRGDVEAHQDRPLAAGRNSPAPPGAPVAGAARLQGDRSEGMPPGREPLRQTPASSAAPPQRAAAAPDKPLDIEVPFLRDDDFSGRRPTGRDEHDYASPFPLPRPDEAPDWTGEGQRRLTPFARALADTAGLAEIVRLARAAGKGESRLVRWIIEAEAARRAVLAATAVMEPAFAPAAPGPLPASLRAAIAEWVERVARATPGIDAAADPEAHRTMAMTDWTVRAHKTLVGIRNIADALARIAGDDDAGERAHDLAKAVRDYTINKDPQSGRAVCDAWNGHLRAGRSMSALPPEAVRLADAARRFPLRAPASVWRGEAVLVSDESAWDDFEQLRGRVRERLRRLSDGFVSTSREVHVAADLAYRQGCRMVDAAAERDEDKLALRLIYRIEIAPGTPALDLGAGSAFDESEVLLPPGVVFTLLPALFENFDPAVAAAEETGGYDGGQRWLDSDDAAAVLVRVRASVR